MKKKRSILLIGALAIMLLAGCGKKSEDQAASGNLAPGNDSYDKEITIIYTNDVHGYIDNSIVNDNGDIVGDGLRFSKIAAMANDMEADGKNVILVDCGDEIQGNIYGTLDQGASLIAIMNAVGYDLATPGNHDFDYGVDNLMTMTKAANYPYISCNFKDAKSNENVFDATMIYEVDGRKVAFIGITTPNLLAITTPSFFKDSNGNYTYSVEGESDPQKLYSTIQAEIDKVRPDVDFVIILGHVGVGLDAKSKGISSEDIIANTTGIDAFIDGHSHTTIEGITIKDREGNRVLLTQTGSYMSSVGVLTISPEGIISSKLYNDYEREDEAVAKLEDDLIDKINDQMNEKLGSLDTTLYVNNPDNSNERWIRAMEMNTGDFVADAIYWYFNEKLELDCDVVLQNGGGIRAQIEKGDFTYMSAKQIAPFGDMICLVDASGQEIIDALEVGTTVIGVWDFEWNTPAENGAFMQVAGLTYTIDASVESSVTFDDKGMFVSVDGPYRVKNVKIYNRETGEYEPIDPKATYRVGGINYILQNGGNGLSMFTDNELTVDYVGQDNLILAEYVDSFKGAGGVPVINTVNSPLTSYDGYLLNYEEPSGAGRINIINVKYKK